MVRRLGIFLIALLGVLGFALGSPAAADGDRVLVSYKADSGYAPKLARPLFSAIDRIVPGDRQEESVWVRNVSAQPVAVQVELRWTGPATPNPLDDVLHFTMGDGNATVAQLRNAPLMVDLGMVGPGETRPVSLGAELPLAAENPTEDQGVSVELRLRLEGESTPTPTPTATPTTVPPDEPGLPITGTSAGVWGSAAALLLAGGAAFLAWRRCWYGSQP